MVPGTDDLIETLRQAAIDEGVVTDLPPGVRVIIGGRIYRQLSVAKYPLGSAAWHEAVKALAAGAQQPNAGAGAGAGGTQQQQQPTITLAPANFDVTQAAADGDAQEVGVIDLTFGAGQPVTDADATVTLTVTLTGTGAGTETVIALIPAGTTAQKMEALITAAWNSVAGLGVAPASKGAGTQVDVTPATGTQVTQVSVAVT